MVGITLDTTDNIGKFLKQTPVSYPIWRYTGANSFNMKAHGNVPAYCLSLSSKKRRNAVQTNHHRRSQRKAGAAAVIWPKPNVNKRRIGCLTYASTSRLKPNRSDGLFSNHVVCVANRRCIRRQNRVSLSKSDKIFIICEYPHFFRRRDALSMSPAVESYFPGKTHDPFRTSFPKPIGGFEALKNVSLD